jgi:hypothetical protein
LRWNINIASLGKANLNVDTTNAVQYMSRGATRGGGAVLVVTTLRMI